MTKQGRKRIVAMLMAMIMAVGMLPTSASAANNEFAAAKSSILDELYTNDIPAEQADPEAFVTVIVELNTQSTLEVPEYAEEYRANSVGFSESEGAAAYRENLTSQQAVVQEAIAQAAPTALFRYSYTNLINGFAAYVQQKDIAAIEALDGVSSVYISQRYTYDVGETEINSETEFTAIEEEFSGKGVFSDTGSIDQLKLQDAWDKGYTGAGKVAAIFDSALYSKHQLFQYYDAEDMIEKYGLDYDTNGGTIRTKQGVSNVIEKNKNTMNMFVSEWTSWFHDWPAQYPDDIYGSGFGEDVETSVKNAEFYTNMKVPFNVDYANGDFQTWNEFDGPEAFTNVTGHGTHVAGITAGNADPDGELNGVFGSAFDSQIFFFKVFKGQDSVGQEGDEDVFAALDDAVTLGVNSFNLSLGIAHGFATYNTFANAGWQRAYNCARNAGISIAVASGNDGRDARPGAVVNGYTALLPNSNEQGFSSSLFSPTGVASAQGLGTVFYAVTTSTTAEITDGNTTISLPLADNNGIPLGKAFDKPLELAYGGTKAELAALAEKGGKPLEGKAALVIFESRVEPPYTIFQNALDLGASVVVAVDSSNTKDSALSPKYLEAGPAFGILKNESATQILELLKPAPVEPPPAPAKKVSEAPVETPVETPVEEPAEAPVETTVEAPVEEPAEAPVETAVEAPVEEPAETPIEVPVEPVVKTLVEAPAAPSVTVKFTTTVTKSDSPTTAAYADSGPVSSTSWGVTEALRLKPEIMAPGGNIRSAGVTSPTNLANMSGTSMATPNFSGCHLLVQQYVDKLIKDKVISTKQNTLEFSSIVDSLLASTARVYQPFKQKNSEERLPVYFSPRRQGAGLAQLDKATQSRVYLHNDMSIGYNLLTGESQRTKVELGDKLGKTFDLTFVVENLDSAAHTFDIQSCLQSDKAVKASDGRYNVVAPGTYGEDIEAINSATMTVKSVTGSGSLVSGGTNINRYADQADNAKISVGAKNSAKVTVSVTLDESAMAAYDTAFPNGMFLDGFVFLDDTTGGEFAVDVSIPFMGFRGDWNSARIFDMKTAYENNSTDVSDLDTSIFHIDNLHSRITNRATNAINDVILGANNYTGAAVPQFNKTNQVKAMRDYLTKLRTAGDLSSDMVSFSPNGDGQSDTVYAQMAFLRNAKMLNVQILDAKDNVVRDLGTEYEYFSIRNDDGNLSQLVQTTGYDKYHHKLFWDGLDNNGKKVPDGQYTFKLAGLLEDDYLELLNADKVRTVTNEYVTSLERTGPLVGDNSEITAIYNKVMSLVEKDAKALLAKSTHTKSFPVKIDTTAPSVDFTLEGTTLNVTAKDDVGVQAIAVYYDGEKIGETVKTNGTEATATVTLAAGQTNPARISIQAVDFAMNVATNGSLVDVAITPIETTAAQNSSVVLTANTSGGSDKNTTYQWSSSAKANSDFVEIKDATSATYSPSTQDVGTMYYRCVASCDGISVTSNVATLVVEKGATPPPSGGGTSDTSTPTTPPTPPTSTGDVTKVVPNTTITNSTANSTLTQELEKKLVDDAVKNNSKQIEIAPKIDATVTAASMSISKSAITNIADKTSASLLVSSPLADVSLSHAALKDIAKQDGTNVVIGVKSLADGSVTIEIKSGSTVLNTINGAVSAQLPLGGKTDGAVAQTLNSDGTFSLNKFSYVKNGKLVAPLSGSQTVRIVWNNAKFNDVSTEWFASSVNFATARELFSGVTEQSFEPNSPMSRAMLVTVLYRLAGSPVVDSSASFGDVAPDAWYSNAIAWGLKNDIIKGMSADVFSPNGNVTREQMAVILSATAKTLGITVTSPDPAATFADGAAISDWAKVAAQWAIDAGLLKGDSAGNLNPQGNATRAEVATLMQRFIENAAR